MGIKEVPAGGMAWCGKKPSGEESRFPAWGAKPELDDDGVDAEADCLLKCSGQYNICLASQVSTQAACMVQNEACQRACKEKKD